MNDDWQERENKIFAEELKKSEERQAERDFLKDKTIAGENALRPSDEFIEENLGKDLNRQELVAEAVENTDARMEQERHADRHRESHERAERQQPQQEENRPDERQQMIDQMREKREQSQQQKQRR